jgi:hypothetical protein
VERLTKPSNFISLLFYFGLLTYGENGKLKIPNETVKQLMYGFIRDGYEDMNVFNVDLYRFAGLIRNMAYNGGWEPVFQFIADEVQKQTAIRDYLTGEKVIQTFLLAYLNITDYFLTRSEEEMNKGFADIYIQPFTAKYPDINRRYLIELEYIKRSEFTEDLLKQKLETAEDQLKQYAADDRVLREQDRKHLTCIAMVYSGWEMKAMKRVNRS